MSDDRCRHDRITFSRRCEIFRCYECEPLSHEDTLLLIEALQTYLCAGHKETRRSASVIAKAALLQAGAEPRR